MKKIILYSIFALIASSDVYFAEQRISNCWACKSKEYFEDITRYIQANDSDSLLRYALSGKCDLLKDETVYVVDYGWLGISKIDWNGMKLYISTNCLKN